MCSLYLKAYELWSSRFEYKVTCKNNQVWWDKKARRIVPAEPTLQDFDGQINNGEKLSP